MVLFSQHWGYRAPTVAKRDPIGSPGWVGNELPGLPRLMLPGHMISKKTGDPWGSSKKKHIGWKLLYERRIFVEDYIGIWYVCMYIHHIWMTWSMWMFQTFGHPTPQKKRFEMTGNQWILGPRNLAQDNRISTKAAQQLMTVSGDHERKGVWNLCRSWVNSQPTAFTISKHNCIRFPWQSACSCASNVLPRSRATRGGTAPNKAEGAVSCKYTVESATPPILVNGIVIITLCIQQPAACSNLIKHHNTSLSLRCEDCEDLSLSHWIVSDLIVSRLVF